MNLKQKLKDAEKVITILQNNYGVLQRGGFDMICPIVPPMQLQQKSCNTNCPLMEIGDNHVILNCGGQPIKHEISKIIDINDTETDSKIISLGKGGEA